MSLGEQNKQHFDHVAGDVFSFPWIVQLCNQITDELRQNVEWIGLGLSSTGSAAQGTKMLDYAAGNGVASRALAPFVETVRGMDISSGMVAQYNQMALSSGVAPEQMRAIQGDLLNPAATPSPELMSSDFFNFDVIVMCMALHHVDDYSTMIERLSERLRPGGALVIVDWVAISESGCQAATRAAELSNNTITRMGFEEKDLKKAFKNAGLKGFSWKWAASRSIVPDEIGGEQQLFLARGHRSSRR